MTWIYIAEILSRKKIAFSLFLVLLGSIFTSSTWAMQEESEKGYVPTVSVKMAPFSVADIIQYAEINSANYPIDYLRSEMGKRHIRDVIDSINEGVWPEDSGLDWDYEKKIPHHEDNKFLISRYISKEYETSLETLSPEKRIVKQIQLWERLEDGTRKASCPNSFLRSKLRCGEWAVNEEFPERKFELVPNNFYGACFDYALTKVLGVSLEIDRTMAPRYRPPLADSTCKYEGITQNHIMPCLHTLFTQVQEPIEGDLAVYFVKDSGSSIDIDLHYGIYCDDGRIESKWGYGPTYKHLPFYVPRGYGDNIKFFRVTYESPITHELLSDLSKAYVESYVQRRKLQN